MNKRNSGLRVAQLWGPKDTISWYPKSKILRICDFKEQKVGGNREQRNSRLWLSHAFGQRPGEFWSQSGII